MSLFEGNALTSNKPRRVQSKFWKCNYHLKDADRLEDVFESIESIFRPLCDKYVFGEEYGNSKSTPHVEGYLIFKKKTEFQAIQKLFKFSDLQKSLKKNADAGIEYCLKEGNEIRSFGLPVPLKKLKCEGNLFLWQQTIVDIVNDEPDDRSIYWFYESKGGSGKTTFCKYLVRFHNAIVLGGKSADMKNGIIEFKKDKGETPKLIVCNIPKSFDSSYLSYTGLEEVKDMLFYSGKYEGGMVDGNPPHLIVFSNRLPELNKMSEDRWKIYNILKDKWLVPNECDHSSDEEALVVTSDDE